MDVNAELVRMELLTLNILWSRMEMWLETSRGQGLGKDMAPHQFASARRMAEKCIARYFDAIEKYIDKGLFNDEKERIGLRPRGEAGVN